MTDSTRKIDEEVYEIGVAANDEQIEQLQKLTLSVNWPETYEEFHLTLASSSWKIWFLRERASNTIMSSALIADQGIFYGIGCVCTHPDYQRRGISAKMIKEIMKRENEIKKLPFVLQSSKQALSLYKNLNFTQVETFSRYTFPADKSIEKVDLPGVASKLGVSFRFADLDKDLPEMTALATTATGADYGDYYKTFLSIRKGQEHRSPTVIVIEKEFKMIAFGGMMHFMGILFLGPIMSPDADIAQFLIQMLIEHRDTHKAGLLVIMGSFSSVLIRDSDWSSRLTSIGFSDAVEAPIFQYDCNKQVSSIFTSFNQGKVMEYVCHNSNIM